MGILNKIFGKSIETKSTSYKNLYEFSVEVIDNQNKLLFIHCFNSIRTDRYGVCVDYFNGFTHYSYQIGSGYKPLFNLFLIHNQSGEKIELKKSLFLSEGAYTKEFCQLINRIYDKYGEKRAQKEPFCYDCTKDIFLIMESDEARSKRMDDEVYILLSGGTPKKEVISNFFLDVFYDWFLDKKEIDNEIEESYKGIENGSIVEYYANNGTITSGEVQNAYGLRQWGLITINDVEIPVNKIIKILKE